MCQVDVSQRKELAKTSLKNMDTTMQKLQHIRSIRDLRPQRKTSTLTFTVDKLPWVLEAFSPL